ncbi:hypothetical protein B0O99DRAFT_622785 [Bisporella sp. PMI_857]|nr:hypothetical protein B0O99DRAFT_622785 [Bisporella sp. PMI_857]
MDGSNKKGIPSQYQAVKVFPQRGGLCLHRLAKPAAFTCNRCSLGKASKLVAFANHKWDEPLCNGCYGYQLAASTTVRGVDKDNLVGATAGAQRSLKTRRARKSARRDRKPN